MAIPKIKATYSLDEGTARRLEEIARKWQTSKSDALTRLINQGAEMAAEPAEVQRKLDALARYQESTRHITAQQWKKFERDRKGIWREPRQGDADRR